MNISIDWALPLFLFPASSYAFVCLIFCWIFFSNARSNKFLFVVISFSISFDLFLSFYWKIVRHLFSCDRKMLPYFACMHFELVARSTYDITDISRFFPVFSLLLLLCLFLWTNYFWRTLTWRESQKGRRAMDFEWCW